jgi:hypothetical protein
MAETKAKRAIRGKASDTLIGKTRLSRAGAIIGTSLTVKGSRTFAKALRTASREIPEALITTYGAALKESRRTGRELHFVVKLRPRRPVEISQIEVEKTEAQQPSDDLATAIEAAKSVGRVRVAEILSGTDMLNDDKFGELLGVSRATINTKRQKHQVLGLEGAKRGFRFPAWQVGEDGKPFAALPELFDRLGKNPWTVYRFLVQHHPELDGLTGYEALQRGQSETVVNMAESLARGAFS